ncbi:carboxymuconolactone decarboxylase family protein [Mycobacterium sp.]|uniref:carboxymuconolactone decarboxylase family protein n=1 Tax=Mycobacterium sp. TaxID=1785 RepID=UPI002B952127|nr:carboxymuconolactone decarboxylase family protein [Mycobacterium sp.]HKP43743.1 carboxymuconolactone decarboxylase family protein [Mycobacterium sp.]
MADTEVPGRLAGLVALSSGDARLDALIRLTCGRALALRPLPAEVDLVDGTSDDEAVVAAFAEQFAVDVTGIGDHQRRQFAATLGDRAFRVVVAIYIADFVPRVWAGLDALGLGKPGNGEPIEWDHDADPVEALLNGFVSAVARLRQLDPVTTEVVRLRGAAQHNCRLCKSLRDSTALGAGGSEDLYTQIEHYESADGLTDAQKAALRYVDALIWTPSRIGAEVAAGVREHFTEDEAFELTLDVMRNACNKIAVAMGADAPRVSEGTEEYRIDEQGQTVFAS